MLRASVRNSPDASVAPAHQPVDRGENHTGQDQSPLPSPDAPRKRPASALEHHQVGRPPRLNSCPPGSASAPPTDGKDYARARGPGCGRLGPDLDHGKHPPAASATMEPSEPSRVARSRSPSIQERPLRASIRAAPVRRTRADQAARAPPHRLEGHRRDDVRYRDSGRVSSGAARSFVPISALGVEPELLGGEPRLPRGRISATVIGPAPCASRLRGTENESAADARRWEKSSRGARSRANVSEASRQCTGESAPPGSRARCIPVREMVEITIRWTGLFSWSAERSFERRSAEITASLLALRRPAAPAPPLCPPAGRHRPAAPSAKPRDRASQRTAAPEAT